MATKPLQGTSIHNPQETFAAAISEIAQHDRSSRRNVICDRTRPIAPAQTEQQKEKRALTDAARALATLWKVSPHLVR